jgi:hypothetical protein
MTQTQNALIEIVWTHITDETSATKLQAELAIEGVVLWLREQGQNDAANLIANEIEKDPAVLSYLKTTKV